MNNISLVTENDIAKIADTYLVLRPHLNEKDLFANFDLLGREGYKMIYIGDESLAYAVLGFREMNIFFSGKTLYIDDLITHPDHRRMGYAGQLIDWVIAYARKHMFDHVSLDSGFSRKEAHRLYLNKRFQLESFHFGMKL